MYANRSPTSRVSTSLGVMCALAVCFGTMVAFVSANLHPRFEFREETVAQQDALLHRRPLPMFREPGDVNEFRNRLLFAALLEKSATHGVGSRTQWFLVWRLATSIAMFFTLLWVARRGRWQWSVIGCSLLAYILILSFTEVWELPFDFPDVLFTLVFCHLTRSRRWALLFPLALLSTLNRESAAFAGLIWIAAWGWSADGIVNALEIGRGALVAAGSYVVVALVRARMGLHARSTQGLGIFSLPDLFRTFLSHPQPYAWPVRLLLMVTPVVLLAAYLRRHVVGFDKRLLLSAAAIFAITATLGTTDELRVFVTPLAVAVYALVDAGSAFEDASD